MSTHDSERRRASNFLTVFHAIFLVAAVLIVIEIVKIQYFWEPDPRYIEYFQPKKDKKEIEPLRGSIIDRKGKLLALSTPMYQVHMDCYVLKDEHNRDKEKGEEKEKYWIAQAEELAKELPGVLCVEGKDAAYYRDLIFTGRRLKKRYVSIAKNIDHGTLEELRKLPLFCKGPYTSGMIVEKEETRQYPYEGLARRVIGYVKHNNDTNARHIGIEGKYDYILHGEQGLEWKKVTDKKVMIKDVDSNIVAVEHGYDIRTTLDINIQDIADRALRNHLDTVRHINSACVVIMDVKTGGIRAIANVQRNKKGKLDETLNIAVGRASEPGSIFKTVMLTALLEDGHTTLEEEMPIDIKEMKYPGFGKAEYDKAAFNYGERHKTKSIPVIDGLAVSSNYVFRRQITDNYHKNPEELLASLHSYNLGGSFSFEIEENCGTSPNIPDPSSAFWSRSTIPSMAIGYSVKVTPLQMLTFYNAIANGGKMMKPYIVESFEKNGIIELDFFSNSNTVVCNEWCAIFFVKNYVSAFWAECNFNCVSEFINTALKSFTSFFTVNNLFSHN